MTALKPRAVLAGPGRDAWLEFEEDLRGRSLSPRTVEAYGEAVAQLQVWLAGHAAGTDVTAATPSLVKRYLAWAGEAPRRPSTAANRYRCLVQFYKYLDAEDITAANPMARVQCPKHEYAITDVVPDEEIARLLVLVGRDRSFGGARDEAVIRTWCEAGSPRASEMAGLLAEDVDMEAKTITLHGKGGRARVIGMSPATAKAWYRYKRARAQHPDRALPQMLLGHKGRVTRSGLGQMLERRCAAAGVRRMHPHQLRHTAFSDFDLTSGNVNHAMALFGWSSPAMAHYYGKAARARQAVAAAQDAARADRFPAARR